MKTEKNPERKVQMEIYHFGTLLKELRNDAHMKQKTLADKLSVTEATISKYECGTAMPPFETMRTIASVFNVSMDFLYGTEKRSTVSTFGLSDNQKEIIEILTQQFRVKNGFDKELSDDEYKLLGINESIHKIHFPENFDEFEKARKRLVFEELLGMQLALLNLKNKYEADTNGIQFDKNVKMSDVINALPFKLTKAQLRVLEEIDKDMESNKNMNRLLQGDVGSGKTAVSIIASYKAVKCGYQVAIMAPTAILASQHLESFKEILDQFGIRCELLISSITKKKKEEILERLRNGEIDILIGTHALLEENVVFKNLGFVVTDEQHRFGVKQRTTIVEKGQNPDVLVMTATPVSYTHLTLPTT